VSFYDFDKLTVYFEVLTEKHKPLHYTEMDINLREQYLTK